jgi:hypothetical protein
MATTFRLEPEQPPLDLDLSRLQAALPPSMRVHEKHDGVYVTVESTDEEDESAQVLINREIDRVHFLTCVRFRAHMCRKSVTRDLSLSYRIHGSLPSGVGPATWTDSLALQFRLWALASETQDPILRVLLCFQIIELTYPNTADRAAYPPYTSSAAAPHPRTEAKLLRHLVAHAGEAKRETGFYLEYLGLPKRLGNLSHPDWLPKISRAAKRVEEQARVLLRGAA